MFTRVQARRYRCLKTVDRTLGPFQALVGPNASGKTTFLDVIALMGDLVRNRGDVPGTILSRSPSFDSLIWMGHGDAFELAVEAEIPEGLRSQMAEAKRRFTHVRYEVEVGLSAAENEIGLNDEHLWLTTASRSSGPSQRLLFPMLQGDAGSLLTKSGPGRSIVVNKRKGGYDNYYPDGKQGYNPRFKLGRTKSALANLPADPEGFPVGLWFRELLEKGIRKFELNSKIMQRPSPPGLGRGFQPDGSNMPWVIYGLQRNASKFADWLDHVRTALSDIRGVHIVTRQEDKHKYIIIEYDNGARVPSWLASDGTLRLLALTIPAYLEDSGDVFLIEEPENGIHPRAVEPVLQSLSSVYGGQVLLATHSPVALTMLQPGDVLCFAKDDRGATDIIRGDEHPALQAWKQGEPDFGTLFASGILS